MKFRKKPVIIDAWLFDGTGKSIEESKDIMDMLKAGDMALNSEGLHINTLEGVMLANPGDYIIKGVQGEFYPCKPDIFNQTYVKVEVSNE